ncbi:hypothetical protein E2562_013927 [Oryza meyeriana var. granulata]|uniref:Uncharacterized protein n=1 Tax=Oryza meyeriana var. granulata TaxID=110450 RepID=A0A6G1C6G8_9ORYZ|nr:hypothetical protein E2562_013927 [Oryza meyeriana var. granulata]
MRSATAARRCSASPSIHDCRCCDSGDEIVAIQQREAVQLRRPPHMEDGQLLNYGVTHGKQGGAHRVVGGKVKGGEVWACGEVASGEWEVEEVR